MEQTIHSKELQQVLEAARTTTGRPGGRKHSPLYEWLWARHKDMAVELNPPRTPNWTALAKQFGALGIFDGNGKAPKPVTVRQTWVKVDRDMGVVGAEPIRKPRGRANPQPRTPKPASEAPASAARPVENPAETPPRFAFAKPKDWTKTDKGDQ